jgi:hypothetical protein
MNLAYKPCRKNCVIFFDCHGDRIHDYLMCNTKFMNDFNFYNIKIIHKLGIFFKFIISVKRKKFFYYFQLNDC